MTVPVVWSRELPSEPTSVRVYRDSLGSLVLPRSSSPATPGQHQRQTAGLGIDSGITTTATTTDPAYDLPYGGHRERCATELAKAQRRMLPPPAGSAGTPQSKLATRPPR